MNLLSWKFFYFVLQVMDTHFSTENENELINRDRNIFNTLNK